MKPPFILEAPTQDFVDRATKLGELNKALISNGCAVICAVKGMGGVGKTELALRIRPSLEEAISRWDSAS